MNLYVWECHDKSNVEAGQYVVMAPDIKTARAMVVTACEMDCSNRMFALSQRNKVKRRVAKEPVVYSQPQVVVTTWDAWGQ